MSILFESKTVTKSSLEKIIFGKGIKKLINFIKCKNFNIFKKFEDFFVTDILANSNIIRFHDQLLDKG